MAKNSKNSVIKFSNNFSISILKLLGSVLFYVFIFDMCITKVLVKCKVRYSQFGGRRKYGGRNTGGAHRRGKRKFGPTPARFPFGCGWSCRFFACVFAGFVAGSKLIKAVFVVGSLVREFCKAYFFGR